jgi:hypothetical protein
MKKNIPLEKLGPCAGCGNWKIRAGNGLFCSPLGRAKAHPHLAVLSAHSLTREPCVSPGFRLPCTFCALAGKIGDEDVEILSRAASLRLWNSGRRKREPDFSPKTPRNGFAVSGPPEIAAGCSGSRGNCIGCAWNTLDLQGDFRLPRRPLPTVRHLRWITGATGAGCGSFEWTFLITLELTLQSAWRAASGCRELKTLELQDLSDPPCKCRHPRSLLRWRRKRKRCVWKCPDLQAAWLRRERCAAQFWQKVQPRPKPFCNWLRWKTEFLEVRQVRSVSRLGGVFRTFPETLRTCAFSTCRQPPQGLDMGRPPLSWPPAFEP